ncbi:hypothetical protein BMETH_746_1 [methanotrophic bacterial endosymbiont of Bathymodiolus sp.]|nr:hypothetical protein BMETH_746_1 [methanotrophic bacterial endosymbiont of Bathymodiolus sp.]
MGVFPLYQDFDLQVEGLPHARGGVSVTNSPLTCSAVSSPRPWGCF